MILNYFKRYNVIAFILKIIGVIVIAWGIISGIVFLATVSNEYGGGPPIGAWSVFFSPILVGFLIIGFGEIIDLLQRIFDQNKPEGEKMAWPTEPEESNLPDRSISLQAEREIKEFYAKKTLEIEQISPTNDPDVFVVKANGEVQYIELGGFSPRLLPEQEAEKYRS